MPNESAHSTRGAIHHTSFSPGFAAVAKREGESPRKPGSPCAPNASWVMQSQDASCGSDVCRKMPGSDPVYGDCDAGTAIEEPRSGELRCGKCDAGSAMRELRCANCASGNCASKNCDAGTATRGTAMRELRCGNCDARNCASGTALRRTATRELRFEDLRFEGLRLQALFSEALSPQRSYS